MGQLDLMVLGSFGATMGGRTIDDFIYTKVKALLVYMVVEAQRDHQRDALAALLWPDQSEVQARLNLRKALSHLRAILRDDDESDPVLVTTRDTARMQPGSYQIDCNHFTALLDSSLPLRHSAAALLPMAVANLKMALDLYRGPFLDQIMVSDSVAYTEWQILLRERLHRRAVEACQALTTHFEQSNHWTEARRYAERHLELEPWDEQAHRALMRVWHRMGQRGAALYQYERCCQVLQHELGIAPEVATSRLFEQIRSGDAVAPPGPIVPPLTSGHTELHDLVDTGLPTPLTLLVGRKAEVNDLCTALRSDEVRLITLTGGAGCGKTRLALEVGAEMRTAFRNGACFVSLADVHDPQLVPATVLQALGCSEPYDVQSQQLLIRQLYNRQTLLILDSCEHVLVTAPFVGALLVACPQVKVLCTSRIPLHLYGEWLYQVSGLSFPASNVPDAREAEAVQLFVQRARAANYDFALTEHNAASIAAICVAFEGVPLAIELAAARMRQLSPVALARRLDQCLDLLCGGPQDVPLRHRSLRASLVWSYDLLTPDQQMLFRSLGMIEGSFTIRDVWRICVSANPLSVQEDLDILVEHKMVLRAEGLEPSYRLSVILWAFAREQLRLCGMESAEPELEIHHVSRSGQSAQRAAHRRASA